MDLSFDDEFTFLNDTSIVFDNNTVSGMNNSQALYLTRRVVQKFLVPMVVFCGVLGNIFNIIVLFNPKMRTSTNTYLIALAISDSLYLLFTLTLSFLHCSDKELPEAALRYIPFARVFADLFSNTAVWLTVCFTLERYVAVRMPMKRKAWCTVNKAKIASGVIFTVCLFNTFPEFFETEVVQIDFNPVTSSKIFACRNTEFAQHQSYQLGFNWWYVTWFTFTPLLLLAIFNSLLVRSVWKANRTHETLWQTRVTGNAAKRNKEQNRVTMMLISVVLVFMICQTPQAVLLVYISYVQAATRTAFPTDIIKIAGNICNFLVQINASVNVFLYSYFSREFRRTFQRNICHFNVPETENTASSTYLRINSRSRATSITSTVPKRTRNMNLTIDRNSLQVCFYVK